MRRLGRAVLWLLAVVPAAWGVTLQYRLAVGQEQRYRETIKATGQLVLKSALGDQAIPLEIVAGELRSLKVTAANDDRTWTLESKSLESSAKVTVQGQTQQETPAGRNFRMRVTPFGDVLELTELAATQRDPEVQLDLRLDSILQTARLVGFPHDDIQVGATWDKQIPLKGSDGKVYTAKVSSELRGITQRDGRQVAEVRSKHEVPLPPTEGKMTMMGVPLPIRVQGLSTNTTTALWDLAAGRVMSTKGTGKLRLELTLVGLTEEPAVGTFDIDSEVRLEDD